jgi:dCMP deaminase
MPVLMPPTKSNRISINEYFMQMALLCAKRGTCLRRNYGAIVVDQNNHVVSTGYTGPPSGVAHCQTCWRKEHNIPSGSDYTKCMSVHAEINALIQAGKNAFGCNMYLAGIDVKSGNEIHATPCFHCMKAILNAHIMLVFSRIDNSIVNEDTGVMFVNQYKKIFGEEYKGQ